MSARYDGRSAAPTTITRHRRPPPRHRVDSDGVTLRGWFYPAVGATGPAPVVVMCHGFAAVKQMYLAPRGS